MTEGTAKKLRRRTVSLDFDGMLHRYSEGWKDGSIYDEIDLTLIRLCHQEGYAVAIVTSRDVLQVAEKLRRREDYGDELVFQTDEKCELVFWDGGADGTVVLITNRKLAAYANVDDRGVTHRYGDDPYTTMHRIRIIDANSLRKE